MSITHLVEQYRGKMKKFEQIRNSSEIRGLKAGMYISNDGSLLCKVSKNDFGCSIEIGDLDANSFYAVHINEKQEVKFEIGTLDETENLNYDDLLISPNDFSDERKDENGESCT